MPHSAITFVAAVSGCLGLALCADEDLVPLGGIAPCRTSSNKHDLLDFPKILPVNSLIKTPVNFAQSLHTQWLRASLFFEDSTMIL